MEFIVCTVEQAGPSANVDPVRNPAAGPSPVTNVNLSRIDGAWSNYWFWAHEDIRSQALAVALAAISGQRRVFAIFETPNPGNNPYTKLFGLYLMARSG
jgi:hypothetical protein